MMKKLCTILTMIVCLSIHEVAYGQCTGGSPSCCQFNAITSTFQTISFQHNVYKTFTAVAGKTYRFTYCSNGGTTTFDNQITILSNTGTPMSGGYNDDFCSTAAQVTWTAPTSGTFRVLTTTFNCQLTGDVSTMAYGLMPPVNDACTGAISVAIPSTTAGSTTEATADTAPTCITTDGTGGGVWYTVVGNGNSLKASLCTGTNYDSKLRVFTGSCGTLVCVTGNDDGCSGSNNAEVTWNSTNSTIYRILVHGYSTNSGNFSLEISNNTPANDLCANATTVSIPSTTNGSTSLATSDLAPTCSSVSNGSTGVWYKVVGNGQSITASLCGAGTNYDTQIRVFTGTCSGFTCVVGNDQFCGDKSEVNWCSTSGTTYHILVHGWSSSSGNYSLVMSSQSLPAKPTITLTGANTENTVLTSSISSGNQWYRNNTAITGATNSSYTATLAGIYKVAASINGCQGPFSDDFPLIVTGDLDSHQTMSTDIYPNPSCDRITLLLGDFEKDQPVFIRISDMQGRLMTATTGLGQREKVVDIHQYATGNYFAVLQQSAKVITKKFVKSDN